MSDLSTLRKQLNGLATEYRDLLRLRAKVAQLSREGRTDREKPPPAKAKTPNRGKARTKKR